MHVELHDTLEDLAGAAQSEKNARVRDRIRSVILARSGLTVEEIVPILGASRRAVQDWIRRYNKHGLNGLPDKAKSGHPRCCPAELFEAVKQRINAGPRPEDNVCTLRGRDVQRILKDEFGIVQKLSSTYDLLHTLGFEPLRPRPRHLKNDPAAMKVWDERAPFFSKKSEQPTPKRPLKSGSKTKPGSDSKAR